MATIKDVAQAAGVSVATVSRVYNDYELVREQTALRVREAAIRLGYVPHGGARSLSTNRTHTLGVILPDLYGEFFSEVIRGIDQTAQRNGFHLLISSSHEGRPAVEAALRSMRGRVDGLIVMWPEMDADTAVRNLPAGFPMVLVSAPVGPGAFDVITIANYDGARAMVQHLLGLGHRRIAIIKGAEGNYDAAERLRGYRAALAEGGVTPSPALEAAGDFSESSGFRATGELLAGTPVPTAIFAANDSMAIGALSALREAKRRVPDDVAVAGFDDIPLARFLDPPLSSVHVDISALGERATLRLLEAVREKAAHAHRTETFPTMLVLRRSCGAAAPTTRPTAPAAGPATIYPSPLRGAS
jgi:LacI family transcriptional regulator, galactose operon repressor